MLKYIVRRLLLIIPVLLGAIIIIFTINYFSTTNPAMIKLGLSANDPVLLAEMEHEMGLDRPYIVQLGSYLWDLLHGDLGDSYIYSSTVAQLIGGRIPNTLILSIGAILISICVGIPLGLAAALHQNSIIDYITSILAILLNAIPGFLIGVVLMQVFGVALGWLPVSGVDSWQGYILPIIAAGVGPISQNARMTRSSVLEVIRQDYVRTAKAKGVAKWKVIFKHALRNSLLPIITYAGPQIAYIITGSMVIETIFTVGGIGSKFVSAISNRDYTMIMATTIFLATLMVAANVICDLLYKVVDPRIKFD